mgnify:FL=1
MLSEYYADNHIACEILYRQLKSLNISHAYIIETNNYYRGYDFALSFAKAILCPIKNVDCNLCGNCDLCTQIDNGNSTELEIVRPDGMWIKKDQLNGLQKEFSNKALTTSAKVYIIDQAEKMNEAAANSILKFLEEPEDNIVAILVVNNAEMLLDTISSRCQKIKLVNKKKVIGNTDLERVANYIFDDKTKQMEFIQNEQGKSILSFAIKFIESIENNKKDTILKENKICSIILKDKLLFQEYLKILLLIYNESLNYKIIKSEKIFVENKDILDLIVLKNDIDILTNKILIILKIEERLKSNCNLNLVLDKLILMLEGD